MTQPWPAPDEPRLPLKTCALPRCPLDRLLGRRWCAEHAREYDAEVAADPTSGRLVAFPAPQRARELHPTLRPPRRAKREPGARHRASGPAGPRVA